MTWCVASQYSSRKPKQSVSMSRRRSHTSKWSMLRVHGKPWKPYLQKSPNGLVIERLKPEESRRMHFHKDPLLDSSGHTVGPIPLSQGVCPNCPALSVRLCAAWRSTGLPATPGSRWRCFKIRISPGRAKNIKAASDFRHLPFTKK